jgi:hypothetical protein
MSSKVLFDTARYTTSSLTADLAEMAKWGISKKDARNFEKRLRSEIGALDTYTAGQFVEHFDRILGVVAKGIDEQAPAKEIFASYPAMMREQLQTADSLPDSGEVMGDKALYDEAYQSVANLVASLSDKIRWGITVSEALDFRNELKREIGTMDRVTAERFVPRFGRFVDLIAAGMPEGKPATLVVAQLPEQMAVWARAC